jgi:hypothetical protein
MMKKTRGQKSRATVPLNEKSIRKISIKIMDLAGEKRTIWVLVGGGSYYFKIVCNIMSNVE